jgi:protein SCO1/2
VPLVPVLITIDPARDTVATLGPALARFGEGFVGLTGSRAELAAAAAGFGVAGEALFDGPEGPVHAHGSLIYLLDPGGRVLAVLPPVLPAETVTRIVLAHARG